MNPNDAIRDAVLRELDSVRRSAKSPHSASIGMMDLARRLKIQKYKQQDVASNLAYLVDKGWAREVREERTFRTNSGTVRSAPSIKYAISSDGVDRLESASVFRKNPRGEINITTIQGVTVVGDGNVVNTTFTELSRTLSEVRAQVLSSSDLSDTQKLEAVSDLDSLQSQLQKPTPDRTIVQRAWETIDRVATVGTLAELIAHARHLVQPFLS